MKKNVVKRILILITTIFCIFSLFTTKVYAGQIGNIFESADRFVEIGESYENPSFNVSNESISSISNIIYNTLLIIGIIIAVIVGIIIGIQFIMGSVDEKAKVKETLIAYVAGCIIIFGAFTIWKVIVLLLQSS